MGLFSVVGKVGLGLWCFLDVEMWVAEVPCEDGGLNGETMTFLLCFWMVKTDEYGACCVS